MQRNVCSTSQILIVILGIKAFVDSMPICYNSFRTFFIPRLLIQFRIQGLFVKIFKILFDVFSEMFGFSDGIGKVSVEGFGQEESEASGNDRQNSENEKRDEFWSRWVDVCTLERNKIRYHCINKVNEKVLLNYWIFVNTVKPVYNGQPWVSKIVARVQKWPLFGGWSLKITINIAKLGITLAVVDRWPLFGGGH